MFVWVEWCPKHIMLCFYFVFFIWCTLCCQFLWIVHFELSLRYDLTFIWHIHQYAYSCFVHLKYNIKVQQTTTECPVRPSHSVHWSDDIVPRYKSNVTRIPCCSTLRLAQWSDQTILLAKWGDQNTPGPSHWGNQCTRRLVQWGDNIVPS